MTDEFLKELYLKAYNFPPLRCSSKHLAGLRAVRDYYDEQERFWIAVEEAMPQAGEIVFVSGGTARHIDGVWYTGMEEPMFRREIQWKVTHWRPIPILPAKLRATSAHTAKEE